MNQVNLSLIRGSIIKIPLCEIRVWVPTKTLKEEVVVVMHMRGLNVLRGEATFG